MAKQSKRSIEKRQLEERQLSRGGLIVTITALAVLFAALIVASVNSFPDTTMLTGVVLLKDTTHPTIISVSPTNNEQSMSRHEQISVMFSEDMNSSTINATTFTVMQRTTPESGTYRLLAIDGAITYTARTATFTTDGPFYPDQRYGNVFTVTISNDVKDIAGNSLAKDYVWSFTTGGDLFNEGVTTSS